MIRTPPHGAGAGAFLWATLVCLTLAACTTAPTRDPDLLPSGASLDPGDARTATTLEAHRLRAESRRALRGSARVALSGPDFSLDRPQRIALDRPDRLRFEILGLFDQIAAILATDGEEYGFFDASTGEVQRGRVTSSLLWRLTKIDLAPDEAVALLLGAPTPAEGTRRAGAWIEPSGRLAVVFAWPTSALDVECAAEDPWGVFFVETCIIPDRTILDMGGEVFVFDPEGRLVELRAVEPGGVLRFRARFEDYDRIDAANQTAEGEGGVIFPKRVTLESPNIGARARFVWKRVMLADELSDRFFRLPAPRRAGAGGSDG